VEVHVNRLAGKCCVVTGAGSGIGRAVAIAFAREGARVVVNDCRTDGQGEATVEVVRAAGGEAVYVAGDVSREDDVRRLVAAAVETYGRLDVMVNNAGIMVVGPVQATTEEDFDRVTAVNQRGTFFGIKHAVPAMRANGGGSIINTSSIAADHAQHGGVVYSATKGGVLSMTLAAAGELAEFNIRVNAVQPGVIKTGILDSLSGIEPRERTERILRETPLGHRKGAPEDCAGLYVFLASDESAFITGQKMAIDGGVSADSHII
jgi:NAD(P)-dependent dehydrogenase (short-subunit alcohol dehydrogenase family)